MFCPQCGVAYREEFTVCADCHVSLVSGQPPETAQPPEELVTIASFLNYVEADMARGVLESHQIEVFLADDNLARIEGMMVAAVFGGVKLNVRRSDEEDAREILASVDSESAETVDFAGSEQDLQDLSEPDGGEPAEAGQLPCPTCETPYKLEDYDPQTVRIFCSSCKAELPRQAP